MIDPLSCTSRGISSSKTCRQVPSTAEHAQPRDWSLRSEKITAEHLQRSAIVYVRQSTQQQVLEHRESTARQYALVDRAIAFGWPAAAVEVIDEDQGHSGSSAEGRSGFQRLLAEVSSDRVGLILGLEMSRLARSCKDWHALLELCGIYRTLLADADGLYDPSQYNDRLLLGLKGTMSEAELHILKSRLQQGMWNKAQRGEVLNHAPIGYVRTLAGDFVIDPDEQVQAVVRLIFEQFKRQGSVSGLLRWLVRHDVKVPVRPRYGANRGELEWRRPNRVTLLNMLHHPIYAGVYRWGHREVDPRRKIPGRPTTGRTFHSADQCRVLIRDRFPAYITWEESEANQQKLAANSALGKLLAAPRHGPSVLAGLVVCGRCGHHMLVAYSKATGQKTLRYSCLRDAIDYGTDVCQSLSGEELEALVTERLLQAVSPASLELSLAATEDLERERKQLDDQWQQRLARSRYAVDQARRQYTAVDPEYRLVARELERRWDEVLRADDKLQAEYARFVHDSPRQLSLQEREHIRALAADVPRLWHASSTTPKDRQAIARLLLEQVTVTVEGTTDQVDVALRWAGGFVSQHALCRPVQTYRQLSNYEALVARIDALRSEHKTLSEIATILNTEGFHPPKRARRFTKDMLSRLLRDRGIRSGALPRCVAAHEHLEKNEWWLADLAAELAMPIATLHRWQRVGWVASRKIIAAGGRWAIYADADELARLRRLRDSPRGWPRVDPLGQYSLRPYFQNQDPFPPTNMEGCTEAEVKCLNSVIHDILSSLERHGDACFAASKKNPDKCRKCRSQLKDCMIHTLRTVRFECETSNSANEDCNGHVNAVANGVCVSTKTWARKTDCEAEEYQSSWPNYPKVTTDPTCNACADDLIGQNPVKVCRQTGALKGALPPGNTNLESWCSIPAKRLQLSRTRIHEVAHLCVGGHDDPESDVVDICDRPDAKTIGNDVIRNCWGRR